jgi:predicted RNA methylase
VGSSRNLIIAIIAVGIGIIAGSLVTATQIFPYSLLQPLVERAERWAMRQADPDRNIPLAELRFADTTEEGFLDEQRTFQSKHLKGEITIPKGVFWPQEAEGEMLPIMSRNPHLFEGKTVMEIGTGSGIVSLFAAQLGAKKVVSTDISPKAIAAAKANAAALGYGDIVEPRLVPLDNMSAFSVIGADESFDIIISNPPYALDLDAPVNTAAVDTGDLGFSIVNGLDKHLNRDGSAILYYASMFYHGVMAKYARYRGFDVRNHDAVGLYQWEAETVFNNYMGRLLERENVDPDAFIFDYETDYGLSPQFLQNRGIRATDVKMKRLFRGEKGWFWYPGMIVIRHPDD